MADEIVRNEQINSEPINSDMREINDWEDLNAKTLLLRGIYANGF